MPHVAVVRPADAGEVPALSAALAQAFASEPLMNWLLPQRTRRIARRELMFALELQTYVLPQDGLVFTADDGRGGLVGGCVALPPGRWQTPKAVDGGLRCGGYGRSGGGCPAPSVSRIRSRSITPPSRTTTSAVSGSGPGCRGEGSAAH